MALAGGMARLNATPGVVLQGGGAAFIRDSEYQYNNKNNNNNNNNSKNNHTNSNDNNTKE